MTPRSSLLGALATTLLAVAPVGSQSSRSHTVLPVRSAILGTTRQVYVAPPLGDAARAPAAILLVLDADDEPQFRAAIANVRFLEDRGAIPPLLVVGIPGGATRNTDLGPAVSSSDRVGDAAAPAGTERFARFLEAEVLPLVRARYRTLPYTVIAGHSLGALFILEQIARRPGPFDAAIAMSPSLWWSNGALGTPYADAIRQRRAPFRLFVSSGAFEPRIDPPTQQFIARLEREQSPGSLAFRSRRYLDDSHALTPLASLIDGLRFVFEPVSLAVSAINALDGDSDSTSIVTAFFGVTRRYAAGARTIGLDTLLPEPFASQTGQSAVRNLRKPGAASVILGWVANAYPKSAAVHEAYADALAAAGRVAQAREEYTKAIALAGTGAPGTVESARAKIRALPPPR